MQVRRKVFTIVALLGVLVATQPAGAEDQQAAAARLFKDGERAFQEGDYGRAAQLFEDAHALRPHLSALWNAARSRHRAGDLVRAANLYGQFAAVAPPSADRTTAQEALAGFRLSLGSLSLQPAREASVGEVTVDGTVTKGREWFVAPGQHTVDAIVDGARVSQTVRAQAGTVTVVPLAPPSDAPAHATAPGPAPAIDASPRPIATSASGLPPFVFWGGTALTLGLAGVTVWSGLDTLSARDAYEATHARDAYDSGVDKELRTNVLLGAAALAAVLTGVSALFTSWNAPFFGGAQRSSMKPLPTHALR